jgi:glycosyltransferase involved in cell wall biosynthesis
MDTCGHTFSIGMPVYNGARFLHESFRSLLNQSYSTCEIIVSDNASTDSTPQICEFYAASDSRIRYIRQSSNIGAGPNFEFVWNEAKGDYFMWAAADDKWHPEWVQQLLPMAVRVKGLAYGIVKSIDEQGNPLRHPANSRNLSYAGPRLIRRAKYFYEPCVLGKANPIYSIFARKSITPEDIALLRSDVFGADMLFVYSLLKRMPIVSTNTVFLMKRVSSSHAARDNVIYQNKSTRVASLSCSKITTSIKRSALLSTSFLRLSGKIEIAMYTLVFPLVVALDLVCSTWLRVTMRKKWPLLSKST